MNVGLSHNSNNAGDALGNSDIQGLQTRLESNYCQLRDRLLAEKQAPGFWTGELSTSSLSTATAVSALSVALKQYCVAESQIATAKNSIRDGAQWLWKHQNADGGFGDTDRSHSNIATSFLVLAADRLAAQALAAPPKRHPDQIDRLEKYIDQTGSWNALRERYGKDKTFVVPILSNCALAGLVSWKEVSPLPFEAAWLPQEAYRLARMPVVSYAIPALVAIGQARFLKAPPRFAPLRALRKAAIRPTLNVLQRMQPASGGYLEATPLTSFVLMNMAGVGHGSHRVAQEAMRFIFESRLPDGSWPIDTNLATWITNLSLQALGRINGDRLFLDKNESPRDSEQPDRTKPEKRTNPLPIWQVPQKTLRWVLSCQHKQKHPFTGANPGGWGWTDLSGAVPDSDDTPAALLTLASIDLQNSPQSELLREQIDTSARLGLKWLLRLQNRDGGWPTFCRGWGKLPFDRSGTDLTAHAIRALNAWKTRLPELIDEPLQSPPRKSVQRLNRAAIDRAIQRGFRFLQKHQSANGAWEPLWFGNQDHPEELNWVYGTSKVLLAYAACDAVNLPECQRGLRFLREKQGPSGGWGGGPSLTYNGQALGDSVEQRQPLSGGSIEETALAIESLIECGGTPMDDPTIISGLDWLCSAIELQGDAHAWPIGFYFAKLWYYEKLYPSVFATAALGSALRAITDKSKLSGAHEGIPTCT